MLLSRKDFAKKCGVEDSYLTTYINRGKIKLTNNQVDITNHDNLYFMQKRMKPKNDKSDALSLDGLFDHLEHSYNGAIYNKNAEKAAAELMQTATEEGQPYTLYPKQLSFSIISSHLISAYERMMRRESELLRKAGEKEDLDNLISEYSGQCTNAILNIMRDLDETSTEITNSLLDDVENDYSKD